MAPTLKIFGLSPDFCTLGVGRYDFVDKSLVPQKN